MVPEWQNRNVIVSELTTLRRADLPFSYLQAALAALLLSLSLLLLGGCGAGSDAGDDALAASQPRVRLLTAQQYSNSIAQVFGEDVGASVIAPLPPLPRTDGLLANGAAFVAPTSDQVSQIQQAAAAIAAAVVDDESPGFSAALQATLHN
jgi:hypothetical protein